ncbi:DUF6563 family protein [Allomuricauda sp. SCSIO 65647]|uniref:DUF6563 family protein n=1 Tax=Allomuricauda sp. SCSIO 65647 TaxID=2908843 RepID=UPI001F4151F7|nr:DUF6563 family protein [Muricauda sp. SCSIO 65647]UJH68085.1 hypothetical protein L0P89_02470 [Muricauda sp. SCSIO 65647]
MTLEEVLEKNPSLDADLIVEKRTLGEIKMSGGNDYRLVSKNKSVSRKDIKKKITAYSNGDTLYLNCHKMKVQSWYSPVLKKGRFLFFVGGISQEQNLFDYQIQESETSTFWKSFGGIGGGIQGAKLAQLRFPYLIDTEQNELTYLNEYGLERLLAQHSISLLNSYREEKSGTIDDNNALLLTYVDKLNALFE